MAASGNSSGGPGWMFNSPAHRVGGAAHSVWSRRFAGWPAEKDSSRLEAYSIDVRSARFRLAKVRQAFDRNGPRMGTRTKTNRHERELARLDSNKRSQRRHIGEEAR
ncbi:MAG: hypothetical protein QOK29_963 [Rhodospirillaceae bacterium]|jgi:hypothetical protein|nr:hypothetical protein [Rhodospirillaceae bacterium]